MKRVHFITPLLVSSILYSPHIEDIIPYFLDLLKNSWFLFQIPFYLLA
jgi:hypothetical protein